MRWLAVSAHLDDGAAAPAKHVDAVTHAVRRDHVLPLHYVSAS